MAEFNTGGTADSSNAGAMIGGTMSSSMYKRGGNMRDNNLANNYPPYDKITRGDVIAGRLGKDQMGGKHKMAKGGLTEQQIKELTSPSEYEIKEMEKMLKKYPDSIVIKSALEKAKSKMAKGGGVRGGMFNIGDKVMVDDSGYVQFFSGFDLSKPATIISKNKVKTSSGIKYTYGLELFDGKKPFNSALESKLSLVGSHAKGGGVKISKNKRLVHGYETTKAATKGDYGTKSVDVKKGYRLVHGYETAKRKMEWGGTAESSETGEFIGGENQSSMFENGGSTSSFEYSIGGL